MNPPIMMLVPSDHFNWLGLEALLRRDPNLRVLDPVLPGDATYVAKYHQPTFILVAADLVGVPIVALAAALLGHCPTSKIIIIGQILRHEDHLQLLELGIACYVRWEEMSPRRLRCILELVGGADVRVASGAVVGMLVPLERREWPYEQGFSLSEREQAVILGLAAGLTCERIAGRTYLSLRTVKRIIAALDKKLNAPTMFVLGMQAVRHGVVPSDVGLGGTRSGY